MNVHRLRNGNPPPLVLLLVIFALFFGSVIQAVDWDDALILTDPTLQGFGSPLAVDGTRLAVGARVGFGFTQHINVYDFVDGAWESISPALRPAEFDSFEIFPNGGVAIKGNILIAAAKHFDVGANSQQGAVYTWIFDGLTWNPLPRLTSDDGISGDIFGSALAFDGEFLVVGADSVDDGAEIRRGAAYIYQLNEDEWDFIQKLTPADDDVLNFGANVAFDGEHIAIGTINWVGSLSSQGAVYLYQFNGTTANFIKRFIGSNNDSFATSFAVQDDMLMVGASGADPKLNNQGAVYAYTFNGRNWALQATLVAKNAAASDFFGGAVAMDAGLMVVGATGVDVTDSREGAIYAFELKGEKWVQIDKLTRLDLPTNASMGADVAISDGIILVPMSNLTVDPNPNQGLVYTYLPSIRTPQNLVATAAGETQIDLTWMAAEGAEAYTVERSLSGAGSWSPIITGVTGTAYSDTGVVCDTDYDYRVIGTTALSSSLPSAVASATTELCSVQLVDTTIGGFEGGLKALGWKPTNLTEDKIRCDKPAQNLFFAHEGECAFRFKGSQTENSKIVLNITEGELVEALNIGDKFSLAAYVDARQKANLRGTLRLQYTDKTRDKTAIVVKRLTSGYELFVAAPQTVAKPVETVVIVLNSTAKKGATYIDAVQVKITKISALNANDQVTVPAAPVPDLRGN